mmetsp:Transcript_21373/g.24835  ORF Transcript_21373/g.24835 Transcript_21373/m.24835 type:complete len:286 (-) Transcript_21373:197-1054(-)
MDFLDNTKFGLTDSFKYFTSKEEGSLIAEELNTEDFTFAPMKDPADFNKILKESDGPEKKLMDIKKGTTTLAFVFNEGILIAVDCRASRGTTLGSDTVRKVIEINDYTLGTLAGGAADCQYWEMYLGMMMKIYELQHKERPSVSAASKVLNNIMYQYRRYGLSMGCMLAGYDKTGPALYYLDNDGTRLKGDIFSVGSGSTFAYGVLDSYYRKNLTLDEAVELGIRAIYHATHRDAASGGYVRIYHVHAKGWTKIHEAIDVNELHYKYANQKGLVGDGDETGSKPL